MNIALVEDMRHLMFQGFVQLFGRTWEQYWDMDSDMHHFRPYIPPYLRRDYH